MSTYASFNEQIIDEFRANDGTVTTGPFGRDLVLLHTTGARTGAEHISPVMGIQRDADTWLVAASKGGAPEHPSWYVNLLAHPDTVIEAPGEGTVEVRVEELTGPDRDAAWDQFTSHSRGFKEYEQKTSRVIPVLALHRRAATSTT